MDGRGGASWRGDVRVVGDRITAGGAVTPVARETVIDAAGLALAPGFIDTHSHDRGLHDARNANSRSAAAMVSQGVRTGMSVLLCAERTGITQERLDTVRPRYGRTDPPPWSLIPRAHSPGVA